MSVLIQREPVINRQKALLASRLTLHAGSSAAAVQGLLALADAWPEQHTVLLNLEGCLPDEELLAALPVLHARGPLILEIPAASLATLHKVVSMCMDLSVPLCLAGAPADATYGRYEYVLAPAGAE